MYVFASDIGVTRFAVNLVSRTVTPSDNSQQGMAHQLTNLKFPSQDTDSALLS